MEKILAWIAVDDTKKALQAVGRYLRKRLTLPIVGVTGKRRKDHHERDDRSGPLGRGYHVYKTRGKQQQPGRRSDYRVRDHKGRMKSGVLELGMSEPGELTVIAQIAKPDMAVITNIGITHIEQLGSRENIYREKLTIQDGLSDGGVLVLNGDDDMLQKTKRKGRREDRLLRNR